MTIDEETSIQFEKVDKHMKEALIAVEIACLVLLIITVYFFWFITQ